ncbi:hypothetical protein Tco_0969874 [Tanacetum coccineum]
MYMMCINGKIKDYQETRLSKSLTLFIRSCVICERVNDYQLGLESYQQKVNLTAPTLTFPSIKKEKLLTITSDPLVGLIYENKKKENRVMDIKEILKLCDATLKRVLEKVKIFNLDVKHGYADPDLSKDDEEHMMFMTSNIEMDDPNITIEEYIRLEEEKARRRGKAYNCENAMYGKIWYDKDVHDLRSVETKFPTIVYIDVLTSEVALSCEPTVSPLYINQIDFRISFDESDDEDYTVIYDKNSFSYKMISVNDLKTDSENDNDKVNMPSFLSSKPTVSYFNDFEYFKDFEKEFPAIAFNDARTSKLDFSEPTVSYGVSWFLDMTTSMEIDNVGEVSIIWNLICVVVMLGFNPALTTRILAHKLPCFTRMRMRARAAAYERDYPLYIAKGRWGGGCGQGCVRRRGLCGRLGKGVGGLADLCGCVRESGEDGGEDSRESGARARGRVECSVCEQRGGWGRDSCESPQCGVLEYGN